MGVLFASVSVIYQKLKNLFSRTKYFVHLTKDIYVQYAFACMYNVTTCCISQGSMLIYEGLDIYSFMLVNQDPNNILSITTFYSNIVLSCKQLPIINENSHSNG